MRAAGGMQIDLGLAERTNLGRLRLRRWFFLGAQLVHPADDQEDDKRG